MARSITAGMTTIINSGIIEPITLVKIGSASGDVNLFSGYGTIVYDGDTYTGAGQLMGVSEVTETSDLMSTGWSGQLTGIPSTLIATFLGDFRQGKDCRVYYGALQNGSLVADPIQTFRGKTDQAEISDSGETSTITVHAESRLADLKKAPVRRNTPEDQKIDFPSDTGFDNVAALQNKPIRFKG